jgi:hypothetical protein
MNILFGTPDQDDKMYKMLILAPLTVLLLAACVVAPAHHHGTGLVVAPALPLIVELGAEPYYYQGGYHYHYNNDRWSYSNSRLGPWMDLPRSHYPKEIRFRDGADRRGRDQGHDRRERN